MRHMSNVNVIRSVIKVLGTAVTGCTQGALNKDKENSKYTPNCRFDVHAVHALYYLNPKIRKI